MKSVAVLLVAILVVAGFAVSGSRAQPVPAVGVAAQQCQRPEGAISAAVCRPLTGALAAELERQGEFGDRVVGGTFGDTGGDRAGDPDWHWRDLIARLVVEASTWFAEHFGRAYAPDSPGIVPEAIFDVAR